MTAEELLLQFHNGSSEWKSWLIIDAMKEYARIKVEEQKKIIAGTFYPSLTGERTPEQFEKYKRIINMREPEF